MSFHETLNSYIHQISCTSKDISRQTGLSLSAISKYRNGTRIPKSDSENFYKLSSGLAVLAKQHDLTITSEQLYADLRAELNPDNLDYDTCLANFNRLIEQLSVPIPALAEYMNVDISFIYRIRAGKRQPADFTRFFHQFVEYLLEENTRNHYSSLYNFMQIDREQTSEPDAIHAAILSYLNTAHSNSDTIMDEFFNQIQKIRRNPEIFDTSVPITNDTAPVTCTKFYSGNSGFKQAEQDFLTASLLSASQEPIFLYNELLMNNEFSDQKYYHKWLRGLGMVLNQGFKINIIHNINRPAQEILIGIQAWLPLYMSGAVHSYYLDYKDKEASEFKYMHCTSGEYALVGEAINNESQDMILYLTSNQPELDYYHRKSQYMLDNAKPLITLFQEDQNAEEFQDFVDNEHCYALPWIGKHGLENIEFRIKDDEWIMISRTKAPKLHFVIYNKKLMYAIQLYLKHS